MRTIRSVCGSLLLLTGVNAALVDARSDQESGECNSQHEGNDVFTVDHLTVFRRYRESETAMKMNAANESQGSSMP